MSYIFDSLTPSLIVSEDALNLFESILVQKIVSEELNSGIFVIFVDRLMGGLSLTPAFWLRCWSMLSLIYATRQNVLNKINPIALKTYYIFLILNIRKSRLKKSMSICLKNLCQVVVIRFDDFWIGGKYSK